MGNSYRALKVMVHEIIPGLLQPLVLKSESSEMSSVLFHLRLDEAPNSPPLTSVGLLIVWAFICCCMARYVL
jgi:hypothetical protein